MVKRLLSISAMLLTVLTASAQFQLLNSDFEQWESVSNGKGEEPVEWSSFLTATGISMVQAKQLEKSTDAQHGQYSAYIYARDAFAGIPAQGNLTNGCINGGSTNAKDASGNYNYTRVGQNGQNMAFTGRPDAIRVWLKGNTKMTAKVAVRLHAAGYYQDPLANEGKCVELIGTADATPKPTSSWAQYEAKFTYLSPARPAYALVTFATCSSPGDGSTSEYMYVDNIEMVYYSTMNGATYNDSPIAFDANGYATVDANYNPKALKYTTGAGATVETTMDENFLLTIRITGNDVSVNPSNVHTYKIQFSGLEQAGDDEKDVNIVVPEIQAASKLENGRYFLKNKAVGAFLNHSNGLSDVPEQYWAINTSDGSVKDGDNHYFVVNRTGNGANPFDYTKLPVNSDNAGNLEFTFSYNGGYVEMYRANFNYYKGTISSKKGNVYAGAVSKDELRSYLNTGGDNTKWQLVDPKSYILNYFASRASGASVASPVTFNISALVNGSSTDVDGFPLGVYSIDGKDMFYQVSTDPMTFVLGDQELTYYGRLDLSLNATYDGVSITDGSNVNDVYDAAKLQVALSGNGAQEYTTFFDEDTYQLTIAVKGYGRVRESVVQFVAPSMTLITKWYGDAIEENAHIAEEYNEAALSFVPGKGTSVTATNYNNGELTVTITSIYGETKSFNYTFATYPAVASSTDFTDVSKMYQANAGEEYAENITASITIETLVNTNLNFVVNDFTTYDEAGDIVEVGSFAVKNLKKDANGNFSYSGKARTSKGESIPVSVNAQLVDGTLYAAVTLMYDNVNNYYSYGISADNSKTFTDDIVVTINGDAAGRKESTVTVDYLNNGNINFSLKNFELEGVGKVGNIDVLNLAFDAETGEFSYNSDLYIAPGSGMASQWMGPSLGAIPVSLRGQIKEVAGNETMALVIDIDFREQMNQVIHVTFGCEAQSTENFTDKVVVTVNGVVSDPVDADVEVGYLANGNINFNLKNFCLSDEMPVGNVSIDNLSMDANGNFTYNGNIFVSKGDKLGIAEEAWMGPSLGIIPVDINGQIYTNKQTSERTLTVVIDIDFQEQMGQTIHVTFGTTPVSYKTFTDQLEVTVNGQSTVQDDVDVKVGYLKNGNINFMLNNFSLVGVGGVGNIALDNLSLDAEGKFQFNGVTRIGEGDDASVETWLGPTLGDVPLAMKGQIYTYNEVEYLTATIEIDMQDAIGQTIHVAYGIHEIGSKNYTDDLRVAVNGTATFDESTVTVGMLRNGNINFHLNNFVLNGAANVGNISVENLEVDAEGKFSYNGTTRISAGEGEGEWLGPALGDVPLAMNGQIYTYDEQEYLIAVIDIDMSESELGQFIHVSFGATPVVNTDYEGELTVEVNSEQTSQDAIVTVGSLKNDNINFMLDNFCLGDIKVGNIYLDNLSVADDGTFTFKGDIRIGAGATGANEDWLGPVLGNVPLDLVGNVKNGEVTVTIAIDMTESSLGQMINVTFTGKTVEDIDNNGILDGDDVTALVQILLGKPNSFNAIDINSDGKISISDVPSLINKLLKK